ncbi:MAG: hypothetical protein SFX72_22990 [Isosphaeraceae bacterium]|nr:hypothetical protein [Isosphaeraceae bacterium]
MSSDPNSTHRRDFARALALAGVSAGAATATAAADDPKKAEPAKPAAEPAIDPFLAEVEARRRIVVARFGKHEQLDAKALASIEAEIAGIVRRAEALRKLSVDNGEGPFPVFRPFRDPLA